MEMPVLQDGICQQVGNAAAPQLARPEMTWVGGCKYTMGSDKHYPEEAPSHRVAVDGFWIDRTPVRICNFANSYMKPATSRSPKSSPMPRIIPVRCRTCSRPVLLSSRRQDKPSTCAIGADGGISDSVRIGDGRLVRVRRSADSAT